MPMLLPAPCCLGATSESCLQATLSDVDDNPEAYMGNRVTVYGEVEETIRQNGFRLEDPALFAGDDVLVLMRDQNMEVYRGRWV